MPEMKTMLLLTERAEPANAVSSNVPPVTIHEGDATLGCTCDRWGHPRLVSRSTLMGTTVSARFVGDNGGIALSSQRKLSGRMARRNSEGAS